jgi:hypothetical protein
MNARATSWNYQDLFFNGKTDKLIVPENPIAGVTAFSIEVLMCPEANGPEEQRFLHVQGDDQSRALLELRSTEKGWYGDVFVHFDSGEKFLNNPDLLHPFGTWASIALVYTGLELRQYVNGKLELSGEAPAGVLGIGRTSIGMRINDISPFKGKIRKIRFSPLAITSRFLVP